MCLQPTTRIPTLMGRASSRRETSHSASHLSLAPIRPMALAMTLTHALTHAYPHTPMPMPTLSPYSQRCRWHGTKLARDYDKCAKVIRLDDGKGASCGRRDGQVNDRTQEESKSAHHDDAYIQVVHAQSIQWSHTREAVACWAPMFKRLGAGVQFGVLMVRV